MQGTGPPASGRCRLAVSLAGRQAAGWSKVSVSNASDSMDPVYSPSLPRHTGEVAPKGPEGEGPSKTVSAFQIMIIAFRRSPLRLFPSRATSVPPSLWGGAAGLADALPLPA